MKLTGYIKAIKENCFAIPIYSDGDFYYYHNITNDFKILSFEKTKVSEGYFIQTYLSKTFDINSIGALVFVGFENFILSNSADEVIDEVIYFLNDLTKSNEYLYIKKEASKIQKILSLNKISKTEIGNIDVIFENIDLNETDDKSYGSYSLSEYTEIENYFIKNKDLFNIKEKIIKRQIENSILDNDLFTKNKEVIIQLFCNYLTDNKSIFERLIIETDVGKSFTSYLSTKSESFKPIEMTIEETLKFRAEEKRKKLKEFNYKFKFNYLTDNFGKEPAYKRYGLDLNYIPDIINTETSKFIIFIDDKMVYEEINQEEIKKIEKIQTERPKVSK